MATLKVSLSYESLPKTFGKIEIKQWSLKERNQRALKALGLTWCAGVCFILVPIAHFVLVPLCVIAGPFISLFVRGQKSMVTGGSGICPKCSAAFKISKGSERWPYEDTCSKCFFTIKINKLDSIS
jgi:hypothetical protein